MYLTKDKERLVWELERLETEPWVEPPDPILEAVAALVTADRPAWGGMATELAAALNEYMRGFQERNPQLRVFSVHLHMDEATPHLHIDFVPFTTGSKRGLDMRVSLKQALAAQGFKGGTRGTRSGASGYALKRNSLPP